MDTTSVAVQFDTLRSVAFGSITGSYVALGTPFGNLYRILKFINTTNQAVFVSTDGVNDHDYIPAGGFSLYDITTNGVQERFVFGKGTQVYVKYASAPGSGLFAVISLYGKGE